MGKGIAGSARSVCHLRCFGNGKTARMEPLAGTASEKKSDCTSRAGKGKELARKREAWYNEYGAERNLHSE